MTADSEAWQRLRAVAQAIGGLRPDDVQDDVLRFVVEQRVLDLNFAAAGARARARQPDRGQPAGAPLGAGRLHRRMLRRRADRFGGAGRYATASGAVAAGAVAGGGHDQLRRDRGDHRDLGRLGRVGPHVELT
jgi:hypothetical protein